MQRIKKFTDRERAQHAELHGKFRGVGPAAIIAALLHAKKRKAPAAGKAV